MTDHLETTSSSSPTFSDLPMSVLEKVVKKLNLLDCLRLRKVSRGLRTLVDSSELRCYSLKFYFERPYPRIIFDDSEVIYSSASLRRWRHKRIYSDVKFEEIQKAIADVSTFLENPKLKIDYIKISGARIDEFLQFLKSLDFQLDVRSVNINATGRRRESILPYLKPGVLEEIRVNSCYFAPFGFKELAETEQWRMAKKLRWNRCPERWQMEKMTHFEEIQIKDFLFDNHNVAMVRDILLKSAHVESAHLESGYLYCYTVDHSHNMLDEEQVVRILSRDAAYDAENRRFSIPNSRDYFQLKFFYYRDNVYALEITRVSEH